MAQESINITNERLGTMPGVTGVTASQGHNIIWRYRDMISIA